MKFGLKNQDIEKIAGVFSNYPEVNEAIIYGSRAKGNYRKGSDIDLTLVGVDDYSIKVKIALDLDNLLLPYKLDLSLLSQIDDREMLNHIKRVGTVFYKRSGLPTAAVI